MTFNAMLQGSRDVLVVHINNNAIPKLYPTDLQNAAKHLTDLGYSIIDISCMCAQGEPFNGLADGVDVRIHPPTGKRPEEVSIDLKTAYPNATSIAVGVQIHRMFYTDLGEKPIDYLNVLGNQLSPHALGALHSLGINKIADLPSLTKSRLGAKIGVGKLTLDEVVNSAAKIGVILKD